jgi:hypothetical protein
MLAKVVTGLGRECGYQDEDVIVLFPMSGADISKMVEPRTPSTLESAKKTKKTRPQVQNVDDEAIVRDPHPPSSIPGERLYRVTRESCECGEAVSAGLPCPHLICAYRELSNGEFPGFLIQRRWFIDGHLPELQRIDLPW